MIILGAGLSGLMAGVLFPQAKIFEAGGSTDVAHKAILRFRTPSVGDSMRVEFRKVRVYKGLWSRGAFRPPDISLANQYSLKVTGRLADRSIWNLDAVDRWIAPEDFLEQLRERCAGRIEWGVLVTDLNQVRGNGYPVVSTIPMPFLVKLLGSKTSPPVFGRLPIHVTRMRIVGADVFQTIYFPDPDTPLYRASMTGELMTVEGMGPMSEADYEAVKRAFGCEDSRITYVPIDGGVQHFGKISPIEDVWRREFIRTASHGHGVYSLGRFAVWRNILADDVLNDIRVIRQLMKGDGYAARLVG